VNQEASVVIIDLAKEFVELVRKLEPKWSKAYYRFRSEGMRYGSNGSYIVDSTAVLIGAIRHASFYSSMNDKGAKLVATLGKESGVFLLVTDSNFDRAGFGFSDTGIRWILACRQHNRRYGIHEEAKT
jgi:hypothetical protein